MDLLEALELLKEATAEDNKAAFIDKFGQELYDKFILDKANLDKIDDVINKMSKEEVEVMLGMDTEINPEDPKDIPQDVQSDDEDDEKETPENIADVNLYNQQMAKSMEDKIYFKNEIDNNTVDMIVDFGCANAELFKYMPKDWKCVGVDNSSEMRDIAKKNFPKGSYVDSLDDVKITNNTLLNMSSVIHEVYSYCSKNEIKRFWEQVFDSGYKYISIRDMMVSDVTNRALKPHEADCLRGPKAANLKSFIDIWGMKRYRDMLHYLLKYRYTEN